MKTKRGVGRQPVTVARFSQPGGAGMRLRLVAGACGLKRVIREPTVNRPGLALAGFTKYFAQHRVQVMGNAETHFLGALAPVERQARYADLLAFRIPCLVFCRGYRPEPEVLALAEAAGVPVFRSPQVTMRFINDATLHLERLFAAEGTQMGSMVDIQGIGVIIRGAAGIGKSECVLGLIERGHSLVSDDVTHLRVDKGTELIGSAPARIKNYMEVRGIGLINVTAMFGIKGLRTEKKVDLVVTLRRWEDVPEVERVGLDQHAVSILGVDVPEVTVPVAPGRDVARLVEVAACLTKLRLTGHNPAREFEERLLSDIASARTG
jgi:HPr kinase/phosphorylase